MPKQTPKFNDGLPEILSPKYDIIFKKIFATRPELLNPFLKSITGLSEEDFEEIIITDPHQFPETPTGKLGVLDIKVIVKSQKVIGVEMQKEKVANFRERIVSYVGGMIRGQMSSGDDYAKLKRSISISICDDVLLPEDAEYHHRYTLYDPRTRSELTDLIEVHILELPKLSKFDDGSDLWGWMKFLNSETKEDLAMIAERSPALKEAAHFLLDMSEDAVARRAMESIRMREADDRNRLEAAVEEGRKEIILAMKAKGLDVNTIAEVTGLTVDDILKM